MNARHPESGEARRRTDVLIESEFAFIRVIRGRFYSDQLVLEWPFFLEGSVLLRYGVKKFLDETHFDSKYARREISLALTKPVALHKSLSLGPLRHVMFFLFFCNKSDTRCSRSAHSFQRSRCHR